MSTTNTPNGGEGDPFAEFARLPMGEQAVMLLIAPIVGMIALSRLVPQIPDWLVTHHVLVTQPTIPIPGYDGTGLDPARLMLATGLLVFTIATLATNRRTKATTQGTRR